MSCNLHTIDWNAISAIVTAIMALIAIISLCQNRRQLRILKEQWREDNRARLNFSVIVNDELYLLKISNIGKETAYNIKLNLSGDLIDNHYSDSIKDLYKKLQSRAIAIEAGVSKYFYISRVKSLDGGPIQIRGDKAAHTQESVNKWIDDNRDKPLKITGSYCDKYDINESFCISDFIMDGSLRLKDDLVASVQGIKKGLVLTNDQYMPIQKSLHIIADKIKKDK